MALTIKKVSQTPHFTEGRCIAALALYLDHRVNQVFPNVHLYNWEADLLVVSKSRRLWEVEIKVTLADWKADLTKSKWENPNWPKISRFYYAVPKDLIHDGQDWRIPEFVPEWAGILAMTKQDDRIAVQEVRKSGLKSNHRLEPKAEAKLLASMYYRFWDNRHHLPESLGCIECRDPELLSELQDDQAESTSQ